MDTVIEFARGPLFRLSLTVCVLGLGYRIAVIVAQIVAAWHRAGDRRLPLAAVASATATWLLPIRLWRSRPFYSSASVLSHLALVVVPFFLAGHAALLVGILPGWWPVLSQPVADIITMRKSMIRLRPYLALQGPTTLKEKIKRDR